MRKILFIGPIGKLDHPQGGDQYKNQLLLEALNNIDPNVVFLDTSNWNRKIKILLRLLKAVFFEEFGTIILSASSLSSYRLLRLLNTKSKKIVYFVIGGVLPDLIEGQKLDTKVYSRLNKVVVEGKTMHNKLAQLGVCNVEVLHNFKKRQSHQTIAKSEILFKTVFISRVIEEKGVRIIVDAIQQINKTSGSKVSCDFYGPIDNEWQEYFNALDDAYLNYGGYLNFSTDSYAAYSQLSQYEVFLFPTYWYGEGFPGVFLDAFMVGLPIVCSDWNMNSEVVQHEYNGLVLEDNNVANLKQAILRLQTDKSLLDKLSTNSKASFDDYDLVEAQKKILELIS